MQKRHGHSHVKGYFSLQQYNCLSLNGIQSVPGLSPVHKWGAL